MAQSAGTPPRLRLRSSRSAAERLERIGVEGEQLDRAADVDGHHDAVAADRDREHLAPGGSARGDVDERRGASLTAKAR